MALVKSCAVCTMHKPGDLCVASAPPTSTVAMEVAKWPKREPTSVCAKGTGEKEPIKCDDCLYWWTPDGYDLPDKVSTRSGIWAAKNERNERRRYCIYDTAVPGNNSVMYYPRTTASTEACGAGKAVVEAIAEAWKGG